MQRWSVDDEGAAFRAHRVRQVHPACLVGVAAAAAAAAARSDAVEADRRRRPAWRLHVADRERPLRAPAHSLLFHLPRAHDRLKDTRPSLLLAELRWSQRAGFRRREGNARANPSDLTRLNTRCDAMDTKGSRVRAYERHTPLCVRCEREGCSASEGNSGRVEGGETRTRRNHQQTTARKTCRKETSAPIVNRYQRNLSVWLNGLYLCWLLHEPLPKRVLKSVNEKNRKQKGSRPPRQPTGKGARPYP